MKDLSSCYYRFVFVSMMRQTYIDVKNIPQGVYLVEIRAYTKAHKIEDGVGLYIVGITGETKQVGFKEIVNYPLVKSFSYIDNGFQVQFTSSTSVFLDYMLISDKT